ncbi:MAG: hypothetical protein KJ674_01785 [Nanoarchaeota archaeon]|nr:hypothetical protein [Nanoarchaeota archaeon]
MTQKQTQPVSIDDIVLAKRFQFGANEVKTNPKNGIYALDALSCYKNGLGDENEKILAPWISSLGKEVNANNGVMPQWGVGVFDQYASMYLRQLPEATIGDVAKANQKLGYKGYIPEALLTSDITLKDLSEKLEGLKEKEELSEEEKELAKFGQAYQILEKAGYDSLRYGVDTKQIEDQLNYLYSKPKEENPGKGKK